MTGTNPFDLIQQRVKEAHERAGEKVKQDLKDKVGVPVEVRQGPRGGRVVIRSRPGEYPRRDTGALQDSITSETIAPGDDVVTAISVNVPYAGKLAEIQRLLLIERAPGDADAFADEIQSSL